MTSEVIGIKTGNINDAAEQIIGFLKGTNTGDVIYFHGWSGFGASLVLKAVVERLKPSSSSLSGRASGGVEVGVDKVIHIDCSMWQSKRALQKAIAEELELPRWVLTIFNKQDEEDDFNMVDQGSRGIIPDVRRVISTELINCRFLVVFHNGSGSYIDLWECGVPALGLLSKRVLWTAGGRFRIHSREEHVKKFAGLSDVAMYVNELPDDSDDATTLSHLLHAEAEEVARYTGIPGPDMSPKIVRDCFLYKALMSDLEYGIDWSIHAVNYWVCDGIIQADTKAGISAWEMGDAVCRNMSLDWDKEMVDGLCEILHGDEDLRRCNDRCVSAIHDKDAEAVQVPPQATSFFLTAAGPATDDNSNATELLEDGMFGHSGTSSLRVIHLTHCTFSFSSPPFGSCRNLRFLLLNHCKDRDTTVAAAEIHQRATHFFQKLWVLELCYTDWYWLLSRNIVDQMTELRELHVKGVKYWSISNLSGRYTEWSLNLSKLRVIADDTGHGYRNKGWLFVEGRSISSSILNTVILDNCVELEGISLRGCVNLKSLLLRGQFHNLKELDISGTSLKTLDLGALEARRLRRLFLLGCVKLRAILWPPNNNRFFEVLHIDTTHAARWDRKVRELESYIISVSDPRLFRSLEDIIFKNPLCIEISSTGDVRHGVNSSKQQVRAGDLHKSAGNLYVDDVNSSFNSQAGGDNGDAPAVMWMCPCPPILNNLRRVRPSCYIRIQDETPTELPQPTTSTKQETTVATWPGFLNNHPSTLHLHDSLSTTCIPVPGPIPIPIFYDWEHLQLCRIERCPNLQPSVFTAPSGRGQAYIFTSLRMFWASQLLRVRYIWDWSTSQILPGDHSFQNLVFLHLDYCPRMLHVLPLYASNSRGCAHLETLEIVCCGDLKEVFPSDSELQQQKPREFSRLKHIHLHELPTLQCIYRGKMLAPNLESVRIKGCWSLKSLPAVRRTGGGDRNRPLPEVKCEKEWWNSLEWDGMEAGHHPSLYKPNHSHYFKKTLLRPSVLR